MKNTILFATLLIGQFCFGQDLAPSTSCGERIDHQYYSLSYCESVQHAEWVYYLLTAEMLEGQCRRSDNFRSDPLVLSGSVTLADYKGSGYDRGHLAPAADMKVNETAMSECFYLSNMSPQIPSFNRGAWKKLEELFRAWAYQEDSLYIATGPIYMINMGTLGTSNIAIPSHYYKLAYSPTSQRMIAFILPNQKIDDEMHSFAVAVDDVEERTKIDFFPTLPDSLEQSLERARSTSGWPMDAKFSSPSSTPAVGSSQCLGIAKSTGKRCKTRTSDPSGYCRHHR